MTVCNTYTPAWVFILECAGGIIFGLIISLLIVWMFKLWGLITLLVFLAAGGVYLKWYFTAHGC